MEKGDIYLGEYEDWYCTPCETFWTETQLIDFRCPDCNRPTEKLKEESYFFRMSKYQDALLAHIEANPDFIQPKSRRNEILAFVREGLRDLSVSRTTFSWGIPVPGNDKHVIYVWFDALANYITALGYPDETGDFADCWPADVHLIGKDILRFHTVYWPTFLMAAGLPLPKKVFAHGWWTVEGQKMSKSLQNVVEPNMLINRYGVDAVRYFLLREVPFGLDGDFSHAALVHRINSDLANDLGNLLNRSTAMLSKYFGGVVQAPGEPHEVDRAYREKTEAMVAQVDTLMGELAFSKALQTIWEVVSAGNKYIDETAPWALAKDPAQKDRLATVMHSLLESQRIVYLILSAFMPGTSKKGLAYLGWDAAPAAADLAWGRLAAGTLVTKAEPLFPRIEETADNEHAEGPAAGGGRLQCLDRSQLPAAEQEEDSVEAVLVEFREEQADTSSVTPPFFAKVPAVHRVGIYRHVTGQDGPEDENCPLHVVAGSQEPDGAGLVFQHQFARIEGIFQGIARHFLQDNPRLQLRIQLPVQQVTLADRRVHADQKEPLPLALTIETNPLFHTPPAAGQHHDGVGLPLPLPEGKGVDGKGDETDRQREKTDEEKGEKPAPE